MALVLCLYLPADESYYKNKVNFGHAISFSTSRVFVNTLTEEATETVTIRTFSNQKPWVDRTIREAVNHRTAAYNAGILSGNMSEYKASCYALRRAVRAAKLR